MKKLYYKIMEGRKKFESKNIKMLPVVLIMKSITFLPIFSITCNMFTCIVKNIFYFPVLGIAS